MKQTIAGKKDEENEENSVVNENDVIAEEVTSLFDVIPGFEQCEASDTGEWLNCEEYKSG